MSIVEMRKQQKEQIPGATPRISNYAPINRQYNQYPPPPPPMHQYQLSHYQAYQQYPQPSPYPAAPFRQGSGYPSQGYGYGMGYPGYQHQYPVFDPSHLYPPNKSQYQMQKGSQEPREQWKNGYSSRQEYADPRRNFSKPERTTDRDRTSGGHQIVNNYGTHPSKPKQEREQRYYRKQYEDKRDKISDQSPSEPSEDEDEDEEQIFMKTKMIAKKKDPVMDSPTEIKKWIEARKRNYPRMHPSKTEGVTLEGEMSILQAKIRKKIMMVTADGRGLMKKLKNMHILKRLVTDPNSALIREKVGRIKTKELKVKQIEQLKRKNRNSVIRKQKQVQMEKEKSMMQKQNNEASNNESQSHNSEAPEEKQIIKKIQELAEAHREEEIEAKANSRVGASPEEMIKHLREKQKEDKQFYQQLLNYKTNSLNYKYSSQTLETNLVLENIFEQSCYLLQIIRYIVKNGYFQIN